MLPMLSVVTFRPYFTRHCSSLQLCKMVAKDEKSLSASLPNSSESVGLWENRRPHYQADQAIFVPLESSLTSTVISHSPSPIAWFCLLRRRQTVCSTMRLQLHFGIAKALVLELCYWKRVARQEAITRKVWALLTTLGDITWFILSVLEYHPNNPIFSSYDGAWNFESNKHLSVSNDEYCIFFQYLALFIVHLATKKTTIKWFERANHLL